MTTELGIIEGFYGPLWRWDERKQVVARLAPAGYRFYLYAPKSDATLREGWRRRVPASHRADLTTFATTCRRAGMRFGMGLSPIGVLENFDKAARLALERRLGLLDEIGIEDLAILFDDVRFDLPDLAARQVDLVHWCRERSGAGRVLLCPSYYTDDPVLDRLFGPRPDLYLETLGELLDPAIEVFWAGAEVCAREFSPGQLEAVSRRLGRRPFLWDNYPVNDGKRMCTHLHLRGFTGRPAAIVPHIAAHGINPALQPTLSCIPALTLAESYRRGKDYCYMEATRNAMTAILGSPLATALLEDLSLVQDAGLENLGDDNERLRRRYAGFDHPGAREVLRWLEGAYAATEALP